MKTLRIVAFAILAVCFFANANAQVVVRARIGRPVHHYHHPYHRHYYHHPYHRPYQRHYYYH